MCSARLIRSAFSPCFDKRDPAVLSEPFTFAASKLKCRRYKYFSIHAEQVQIEIGSYELLNFVVGSLGNEVQEAQNFLIGVL